MTDKPTPTDAELEALLLDKLPASKHYIRPVIEKMVAAMQAAIDKWGQPAPATQQAPQQEAQEPSHRETVDVVGVRSNGEHVNLEKIAMPPRMKAREIAIEQFGSFKDDDGSDAEMCFGALEYFLEWLIQQGWSKAPQPAPDCHHRPPCDECAALAAQGGKDA